MTEVKRGSITVRVHSYPTAGKIRHVVTWTTIEGRRRRAFSEHAAAMKYAAEVADKLARGNFHAAQLTREETIICRRALEIAKANGVPLDRAMDEWAEMKRQAEPCQPVSLDQAVEDFMAGLRANRKSAEYLRTIGRHLRALCSDFRNCSVLALRRADVVDWLNALPLGPRSRYNYAVSVKTLVNWCRDSGLLPRTFGELEGLSVGSSRTANDILIYTPWEMRAILRTALDQAPEFLPFLVLGAFAGVRTEEIARLSWSDITATHVRIAAGKAKTRQRRIVPISANLAAWLMLLDRSKPLTAWKNHSAAQFRFVRKTGVAWKKNALRHSFGTYRLAQCQDENRVAREMGNSPAMVFRHYAEAVPESDGLEWFGIMPDKGAKLIRLPAAADR